MSEQEMIRDGLNEQIVASVKRLAQQKGGNNVTVRDVLKDIGITNRVFYNRYHNIDEVLKIVYDGMIRQIRESLSLPIAEGQDFFAYIHEVAARTLRLSYEYKQRFNGFVFERDSGSPDNYEWWKARIIALIDQGKACGKIRPDLDGEIAAYAVWCFIRGFNADALGRMLPRETAEERFHYGFELLLGGMRPVV